MHGMKIKKITTFRKMLLVILCFKQGCVIYCLAKLTTILNQLYSCTAYTCLCM
jgi:hypothetical protein